MVRLSRVGAVLAVSAFTVAGCSRESGPASAGSTPASSQSATRTSAPSGALAPVTLPDLASTAVSVRDQLRAANGALETALNDMAASPSLRAQRYAELGNLLLAATFFDEAVLCYRHAERLEPEQPRWPYLRAHANLRKGDRDAAASALERTLELQPEYVPALVWLGDTYLDLGRVDDAQKAFSRALAHQPDSAAALFGAGRAALTRRSYDDAVRDLEQALRVDPTATVIHYPLAMAYRGRGEREKADALLKKRGAVAPDLADPMLQQAEVVLASNVAMEQLGMQALRRQDWSGAIQAFKRGLEIAPGDPALRYWMATAMIASGDAVGAEREFRTVVRTHPEFANAHFSLGAILDRQGQKADALREYEAAVNAAPTMPEARLRLADTLRAQGQLAPSLPQYDEAVKLDPTVAEAWIGGAQALIAMGRIDDAREWLARARRVHPNRRELADLEAAMR
jgi:tetratricopeptide (TPR) repeat protein